MSVPTILALDTATEICSVALLEGAHPTHIERGMADQSPQLRRIAVVRANASELSHAELDAATREHYYHIKLTDPDSLGGAKGSLLHDITMASIDRRS